MFFDWSGPRVFVHVTKVDQGIWDCDCSVTLKPSSTKWLWNSGSRKTAVLLSLIISVNCGRFQRKEQCRCRKKQLRLTGPVSAPGFNYWQSMCRNLRRDLLFYKTFWDPRSSKCLGKTFVLYYNHCCTVKNSVCSSYEFFFAHFAQLTRKIA